MNDAASRHADARVARLIHFYEHLSPAALDALGRLYRDDARFKDPFNDLQGVRAIRAVFDHMYRSLDRPRFVVHRAAVDGDDAFLTWTCEFRFRRVARSTPQRIRGATHLAFDADGRVALHRDYWDAAEELYEKMPALGMAMRWLRRRVVGG